MENKIRFAVCGCGHIGKRHADIIENNPEAELAAIIDIKPRNEIDLSTKAPYFSSLNEFLSSEIPVDIITIATPNGLHIQQAMAVLEHAHVVIEKPMGLHYDEAELLIQKATNGGKKIFTVMQNRYSPPSTWLKQLVHSGVAGKIFMVQMNLFWNRDERYYFPGTWHGDKQLDE